MKNILIVAFAAVFALGLVFGGEIKDAALNRVLAFSVYKIFSPDAIAEIAKAGNSHLENQGRPDFREVYRIARQRTYDRLEQFEQTFGGDNHPPRTESPINGYIATRTVLVACVKEELHKPDRLKAVYMSCRENIGTALKKMPAKNRAILLEYVQQAKLCFVGTRVRKNEDLFFIVTGKYQHQERTFPDLNLLQDNLTGVQTAKAIEHGFLTNDPIAAAFKEFDAQFKDRELAKFAFRRSHEGGAKLVNEYLAVLELFQSDLIKVNAEN